MRVIATINQKGGVGKTTTVLNLSHALTLRGKNVTVMDMDPQAHLTAAFGVDQWNRGGMDEVLLSNAPMDQVTIDIREKLRLVPAGPKLAEVEYQSNGGGNKAWKSRKAIDNLANRDFVILDCPPSSGILTTNAIFAADEILIPVTGNYLPLLGLSRFMGVLGSIEQQVDRVAKKWVLLTQFQRRRRLAQGVQAKLMEYFPQQVLATPIRENVSLAESPGYGKTIFDYKLKSNGADDYLSLADDLIQGRTL